MSSSSHRRVATEGDDTRSEARATLKAFYGFGLSTAARTLMSRGTLWRRQEDEGTGQANAGLENLVRMRESFAIAFRLILIETELLRVPIAKEIALALRIESGPLGVFLEPMSKSLTQILEGSFQHT